MHHYLKTHFSWIPFFFVFFLGHFLVVLSGKISGKVLLKHETLIDEIPKTVCSSSFRFLICLNFSQSFMWSEVGRPAVMHVYWWNKETFSRSVCLLLNFSLLSLIPRTLKMACLTELLTVLLLCSSVLVLILRTGSFR